MKDSARICREINHTEAYIHQSSYGGNQLYRPKVYPTVNWSLNIMSRNEKGIEHAVFGAEFPRKPLLNVASTPI